MTDEPKPHKASMVAETFGVQCPLCDMCTGVDEVEQDDAGVWHPAPHCKFIQCAECGAELEVQGVTMEGTSEPFFRNTGLR